MPNWCQNTTYVFGKTENVKPFLDPVLKTEEDPDVNTHFMAVHFPCPEDLKAYSGFGGINFDDPIHPNWAVMLANGEMTQERYDELCKTALENAAIGKSNIEKYGYSGWYEWQTANWGTKWGDCDLMIDHFHNEDGTTQVILNYDTAWGPMLEGLDYLSQKFPKLIFTNFYSEPGMGFQGYFKIANGNTLANMQAELIPTSDDYSYIMDCMDEQELSKIID